MDVHETVQQVRLTLKHQGVAQAMRVLNRAGSHRFTALYRFDGDTLRNLHLVDRDDPTVERCPDLPVLESYCMYVRQLARTFSVSDALNDERVGGHPKQNVVQSYCGIPLMDQGGLFGTICHFDYDPIPFTKQEVTVLDEVAPDILKAIRREEAKDATEQKTGPLNRAARAPEQRP